MFNLLISCIVLSYLVLDPCSAAGGGGGSEPINTPVLNYKETVEKLFEKTFDLFNKTLTFYPSAYPVKSFTVVYPGTESQKMFNIELKGEVKFEEGMLTKMDYIKVTVEDPVNNIWMDGPDVNFKIAITFHNIQFSYVMKCELTQYTGTAVLYVNVPQAKWIVHIKKNHKTGAFTSEFDKFASIVGNVVKDVECEGYPYTDHVQLIIREIKSSPFTTFEKQIMPSILDWPIKRFLDEAGKDWNVELCVIPPC